MSILLWGFMRWILILAVTAPFHRAAVPFVHIRKNAYRSLNGVFNLYADLFFSMTWSPTLQLYPILVDFFAGGIVFYLRLFTLMHLSPILYVIDWKDHGLAKNSCPGIFLLVLWYVDCTKKAAVARITIHGSA